MVTTGAKILRKANVVYVVGKLGNSVSTNGKKLANNFATDNQMSEKFINYLDLLGGFEFSENTIYFIDGWFGLWNDNPCEERVVRESLNLLSEEIKSGDKDIKFVIGVRAEVLKRYGSVFKDNALSKSLQMPILLDSATQQNSSIEKHLETIREKCDIADCPCKRIEVIELMEVEKIGAHLILKLLEIDHNFASEMDELLEKPLDAMIGHFKSVKLRDKDLFAGILYMVLNGSYDENNFNKIIAENFDIEESCFDNEDLEKYTRRKESLAPTWSSRICGDSTTPIENAVVFCHNFLYISAFHACYDESDEKKKFLLHCNMDAVLQLVRPSGDESDFTVKADLESISTFYEERIKGGKLEEHVQNHPLMVYLKERINN